MLLEAQARGNALISTRTEGGNFLVTDGVNGLLYDFGNQNDLAGKIEKLISDKNLINKMKVENLKRVVEYSWEKIYQKYYKNLLG